MKTKPFITGITGGSGSGKTFFLNCLLKHFSKEEACFISQDDYYLPAGIYTPEENKLYNFDRPEAIDHEQFLADIQSLIGGRTVYKSTYTFHNPDAQARMLEIKPAPIILIEGIFILHFPETARLLDMRIFLDTSEETALQRRLQRDKAERGYSDEDILYKWQEHVMPAYRKFLLPHKNTCDQIIINDAAGRKSLLNTVQELADVIKTKAFSS